jgi:hypothetical protein
MDDFVITIKNNLDKSFRDRTNYINNNRYRTLISIIINNPVSKIIIDDIDEGGDVRFYISMKDLGINFELFTQYKTEIFSDFMANFLGELIVRENLDEFSKMLTSIKIDDYHKIVNKYDHYQFGLEVKMDKFVFIFHVSLIQNILTESFKRKIKNG